MEKTIKRLENIFKIIKKEKGKRENLHILEVEKDSLHAVLSYLKDNESFKHLALVSCVDWIEDKKFQLSYILWSYQRKENLIVKIFIDREKPDFKTIMNLFPQAEVYEREIKELYGVDFEGNPTQNEEFVLEDWDQMPPMRRDFDTLKYSNEMYGDRDSEVKKTNIRKIISDYTDEWRRK
jgi:NADH-quinone oxidoreductase subunit C